MSESCAPGWRPVADASLGPIKIGSEEPSCTPLRRSLLGPTRYRGHLYRKLTTFIRTIYGCPARIYLRRRTSVFLVGKIMVISVFCAVCGLSLFFFAAFFLQCCRSASRKTKHVIRELSLDDSSASPETTRLFAQWEKEMAEFMARQGRSTALLFLIAASSCALLRSNLRFAHVDPTIARLKQQAAFALDPTTSLDRSRSGQALCKKN